MKFKLYARKSVQPKGVPAGTAKPVGPLPVRDALRFGATVNVLVCALSPVPATAAQIMLTVLYAWSSGREVWPRRYVGPRRVTFTCERSELPSLKCIYDYHTCSV